MKQTATIAARRAITLATRVFCAAAVACSVVITVPMGTAIAASAQGALPGSIGLRLLDAPVGTSGDPRAQIYIVDHLVPGTVINRRIEVSNTTPELEHLALYPAAATIANGSFVGANGRTPNHLSTWTSVDPSAVDVPSGGRASATVRIAVPRDAAPGEQYGVVWAEARSAPGESGGVTLVNRVGLRLYVSAGPGGAPAADFTIDSLTARRASDGRPTVRAMVHNTGGRALDLSGTLRLSGGPGGVNAGPFPANLGVTLAIGDTEPVTIPLDRRLPRGPWDAHVSLRSGLLERKTRAVLTFSPTGTSRPVDASSTPPGWLFPAIALAVALLGLAALLLWRRRRGHGPGSPR